MNMMMLLEMAAAGSGERTAFVNGGDALTYQALFDAAGSAAAMLLASGGKHLAMLDENSLACPVGLFASAWAGMPYVPINYRLTGPEIDALLERVTPCVLVASPERAAAFAGREGVVVQTREEFLAAARSGATAAPEWSMDAEDIAVLLFTSGTTGVPKAAILRQKHLVSYILGSVEFCSAAEEDAALVCVPPYHVAGIAALLSSVYSGRKVVQLANFTPEAWLELARRHQVSNAFVVPTMLARIVEALDGAVSAQLPRLRAISYGGGKMPLAVIERAMTLFPGTDFTNAYGLTETSSTIAVLGPQDHRDAVASDDPAVRRRLVSVGRALPGVAIEIRSEEGQVLGPGERGEIYVRGEQVSGEYAGRGSALDRDGWFPTRDAGSMDADGYLFLEGRADDVIVRGGENMSPGEIEDVLLEHEAVADAAVVGIADEQWGEAVAAAVVLKAGAQADAGALQCWVKDRLRSSRVPQRIEFWPELPYNETGKLLRRVVKAELARDARD
ncbi:MAG: acyl--CoA ligase [Pseudomonadales bacterium]|jgi:acyl-CoA synthetase (AMP-forming)/AMP-acid ligase II|nr:acyl--CoA ligase [Pseudomonadales bacterium]MBP9032675.1 acyl--CoA ligase [Pseudomonadales bacterium]